MQSFITAGRWRPAIMGLALTLALVVPATADTWVSVTDQGNIALTDLTQERAPAVRVLQSDTAQLHVDVALDGVALENKKTKAGPFIQMDWTDAASTNEIGWPELPVLRRLFVAPHGAAVSATYDLGQAQVLDLAAAGTMLQVKPHQAPIPKLPGAIEAAPFDLDPAAYALNADWPTERVVVQELGISRGQRLFLLEVRPVAYNPAAGEITLWPDIDVQIEFDGAAPAANVRNPLPGLSNIVMNPDILPRVGLRGSGNYLIITHSNYQSAIAPFAAAKQAQGFTVTTWVPTTTTTSAIKSYIQGLWGTANEPEYILLVGDAGNIPNWVGGGEGSPDTDIQYACMDGSGDWYPDIAIGRFPVDNPTDVQTMIDKTLYYENGPLADPGYKKRAVFMAGNDNYQITEGTHEYVINNYMIPFGYSFDRVYEVSYGGTTQDVSNSFNAGRFYGIYSGHGANTYWADGPEFTASNVNALTNLNMYPMICSFACVTGDYAGTDKCFMETWVLAVNKGAVTAWGSSVNSYWDEDDILERVLFDAIFDNSDDVKTEIGPIYNESKMRLLAHYGATSTVRRYFEMYNLMGDPAMLLPAACSDAGEISLDSGKVACEDTAQITVTDCGLNLDDNLIDTVNVTVVSTSEPAGELVTLYETDAASAEFSGTITVSGFDTAGVLLVAEGDLVTATYIDADDGQGGTNVAVTADATVDCTPPSISNIHTTDLQPRSATIAFDATEPVVGIVDYGLQCDALNDTATGAGYSTSPVVNVSGLQDDTLYYYKVRADDEAGNFVKDDNDGNCYTFVTPDVPDFFTELFTSTPDLSNLSLAFSLSGTFEYYDGCADDIVELPTDPTGGTNLSISDDGSATINLTGGTTVSLYGDNYSTFYINANGNITFDTSDSDTTESLEDHFDSPRISGLFTDLNPAAGGTISWKQLADRIVVTWQNVPEYNTSNYNTFQIEMYFDGTIVMSYLDVTASAALAGLSEGVGLDPDFYMSDLSGMGFCGPKPPRALNVSDTTACDMPVTVTLEATDDGLPDPPAALEFAVTALPAHGALTDPNAGAISSVPYTLVAAGDQVIYQPDAGYTGADSFNFIANDGGSAPDGGDSNEAVASITVGGAAWDPVAHNVATSTACDMGTDIALNATDPNNDALTFLIQSLPAMGSLSDPNAGPITGVPYTLAGGGNVVHYVPPAGTNPPDTFTFSAQDATAESNTATVTVTIGGADWDPVAHNVSASTGISLPVNVTLNGTDPNSDPLAYVIEVLPAYGYLADPNGGTIESVPYQLLAGGNVVMYQPPCGLTLADDFGYCVHDATATSNSATADVTVNADDPRLVYDFPMDTNPGWSMEGDWAFGQPTGGGTHNYDPTSGHTGDNVLGYNLSGDYPSRMPEYALTTTALDCSNLTEVELRFWRWLGVEAYDTANVEVSNDGANWQLVWENPSGSNVSDASWMLQTFDISAYADHQPTVYLRWNMGPTDSSVTFPGWNIDDVQIWALVPPIAADFNGDGLVTLSDHDVLCGCLAGPQVETPLDCMCIDLDGDADVDLADFAVFQQDMVTP